MSRTYRNLPNNRWNRKPKYKHKLLRGIARKRITTVQQGKKLMKTCSYCNTKYYDDERHCPLCRHKEKDNSGKHEQTPISVVKNQVKEYISLIGKSIKVVVNKGPGNIELLTGKVTAETTRGLFVEGHEPVHFHEWFSFNSKVATINCN